MVEGARIAFEVLLQEEPFPPQPEEVVKQGRRRLRAAAVRGRGRAAVRGRGRAAAGEGAGEVGHGGRGHGVAIEWDADMADFLMDHDDDLIDFPFDNPMPEAPANAQNVPPVAAPNAPVAPVNAGQQPVQQHLRNRGPLVGANEQCPICMFNVADHGLDGCRHCFCLPCLQRLLAIRQGTAGLRANKLPNLQGTLSYYVSRLKHSTNQ
jgi:hypothetical protein